MTIIRIIKITCRRDRRAMMLGNGIISTAIFKSGFVDEVYVVMNRDRASFREQCFFKL